MFSMLSIKEASLVESSPRREVVIGQGARGEALHFSMVEGPYQ